MKRDYKKIKRTVMVAGLIICGILGTVSAQAPVIQTFTHTGAVQAFTVPACVGNMTVELRGAAGSAGGSSGSSGGYGGTVRAW